MRVLATFTFNKLSIVFLVWQLILCPKPLIKYHPPLVRGSVYFRPPCLLATFIPSINDKLGNITLSKNYRSIAISSLTLKVFDWILLILFGGKLQLDELQFAYQKGCSTTMCTWSIVETTNYFLRNGSDVFICCMDMTKAFDLLKHSKLFIKLFNSGIPPIFLRLIFVVYRDQFANVRWNGSISSMFTMHNGVRQGAVASAVFYCFYGNILFGRLRRSGYGCWVNGVYHGIFGDSDDNLLIAPNVYALQRMLDICESFASVHNLKFSTDVNPNKCKTKCIAFLRKQQQQLPNVTLCGNSLPWVEQFNHLGRGIYSCMISYCLPVAHEKNLLFPSWISIKKCLQLIHLIETLSDLRL